MGGRLNPQLLAGGDPCDIYKIGHSVRLNSADGAHMTRTPSVNSNRTTWTKSFWLKRSKLATTQVLFDAGPGATRTQFYITASDNINFISVDAGIPNAAANNVDLFRDIAAHYHFVVVFDTNNATPTDRIRIYVNNRRLSLSFTTTPAQGYQSTINAASNLHRIGRSAETYEYTDGYLSDIHFVDGQALDPSAFGFSCPATGQWRPKRYTGTYGVNGFHLDFSDGSAATSSALGKDRSGNNNDWTPTDISVAAGVGCDWLEDTPTNNFATFNPLHTAVGASSLSNGALTLTDAGVGAPTLYGFGTIVMESGQWYAEMHCGFASPGQAQCGVSDATVPNSAYGLYRANGSTSGLAGTPAFATYTNGDVIGIEYDAGARTVRFYKNGVLQGSGAYAITGTAPVTFVAMTNDTDTGAGTWNANFGQRAWGRAPTAGYKAPCVKNLPVPAIKKSTQAVVAVTDSGGNIQATLAAARAGWTDYIEIFKRREVAEGWRWRFSDDLANYMDSSSTAAKAAFPALGGTSYVGYALRVGVTYGVATGRLSHVNGAADVVADGLATARKMVILVNEAGSNWYVYHPDLTAGKLMYLNLTSIETADTTISAVGTSGFTVAAALPTGTYRWIALAERAGLIKLGKYIGNGLADGPTAWFGLRPLLSITKCADTLNTSNWDVHDGRRSVYNASQLVLQANSSGAEINNVGHSLDFVGYGLKVRTTSNEYNESTKPYICVEFAEFPFKYANAR